MSYPYNYVGVEFNVSELKAKLDDLIGKYGENFTIIVERTDYETYFGEDYYVGMKTNGLDKLGAEDCVLFTTTKRYVGPTG